MVAPGVFVRRELSPVNEKGDTHALRKRLINWRADISEFIIKRNSFGSPTTILANPSSQATSLRDLSYKYSPNQNKWLKPPREFKAIHIYIRRNWCNSSSRLCTTDLRFKLQKAPTYVILPVLFCCCCCSVWQTYIHDSQVGETQPPFYASVMLNSHSSMLSWCVIFSIFLIFNVSHVFLFGFLSFICGFALIHPAH